MYASTQPFAADIARPRYHGGPPDPRKRRANGMFRALRGAPRAAILRGVGSGHVTYLHIDLWPTGWVLAVTAALWLGLRVLDGHASRSAVTRTRNAPSKAVEGAAEEAADSNVENLPSGRDAHRRSNN